MGLPLNVCHFLQLMDAPARLDVSIVVKASGSVSK
jgi:hypothetical protein